MIKLLYNLFTTLYVLSIKLAAPFNSKARLWLKGRSSIFQQLTHNIRTGEEIVWMHCASLGEFEQGRPVLEYLKKTGDDNTKILLTFFSPSGYEVQKNYAGADYIFYLPMDTRQNTQRFLSIVQPRLILFVKYEFWYYYLQLIKQRNITLLLISGIFREDQPFFKWYGTLHRNMLSSFTHLFVQNQESAGLLHSLGYTQNVSVSGDTRFDRVVELATAFTPINGIEDFCGQAQVVVAGSTWSEDDKALHHIANTQTQLRFIIAPHNIDSSRISECQKLYKHSATWSQWQKGQVPEGVNTLIIDNVGMLNRLYHYATICYVGGAFGADGVHNVLEPAVYGKPVLFGPEYQKYIEAAELVEAGGGKPVSNALELEAEILKLLGNHIYYHTAANASKNYVYQKTGATRQIVEYIYEKRLLTS